jgi:NADPH-dependent 2,4-dienoyl-CoA reductase/sulfur reductase-like enzyme
LNQVKEIVAGVTEENMQRIIASYAEQASILKKLGFDMVSIHMCYRGQLVSKFLSPLTNGRTDEYGGNLENRARFPLMVLRGIREACGNDIIIELLLSGEEPQGGYTVDDAIQFLKMADPYADIVQVRAPDADPNHPTGFNLEETPFLSLAEKVKKGGVKMLVSSVGGWQNPDTAEKALADGKVDMVSMARAWICNSNYGQLVSEERADDITPCLRCNRCHGRGPGDSFLSICSVNPLIGIEHRLTHLLSPTCAKKKVAVVGGGPAGMKAAIDLHDKGHEVTIFESTGSLGGMIRHADYVDFKWPLRNFKSHLVNQVEKRGIQVRLNTMADPDLISSEAFDAAVIALGTIPHLPPIPGASNANVFFAADAMMNPDALGERIAVVGGGEAGVEAGMLFASKGKHVTVIEMRGELAADSTLIHYRSMFREAWEKLPAFHAVLNARCGKISGDGVEFTDASGKTQLVAVDSVVIAAGMKPRQNEALAFHGSCRQVFYVGDCVKPAPIESAMRTAYAAASQI